MNWQTYNYTMQLRRKYQTQPLFATTLEAFVGWPLDKVDIMLQKKTRTVNLAQYIFIKQHSSAPHLIPHVLFSLLFPLNELVNQQIVVHLTDSNYLVHQKYQYKQLSQLTHVDGSMLMKSNNSQIIVARNFCRLLSSRQELLQKMRKTRRRETNPQIYAL